MYFKKQANYFTQRALPHFLRSAGQWQPPAGKNEINSNNACIFMEKIV